MTALVATALHTPERKNDRRKRPAHPRGRLAHWREFTPGCGSSTVPRGCGSLADRDRLGILVDMERWPPSQAEIIEAFLKWLNAERRAHYVITERPDEVNRNRRDIDYVLDDPDRPPRIAVEVSSVWRSEEAGKEDAYIGKWFERVRERVRGRVSGMFYVFLPVRVPNGLDPERFGDDLLGVILRETAALAAEGKQGKGLLLDVQGVRVHLHKAILEGSDIDYGRFMPDLSKLPERVRAILHEKAPKLKRYKDDGLETWIVAYNTAWAIMSLTDTKKAVASLLGSEHAHVDHVGICIANPPDDAWMIIVR